MRQHGSVRSARLQGVARLRLPQLRRCSNPHLCPHLALLEHTRAVQDRDKPTDSLLHLAAPFSAPRDSPAAMSRFVRSSSYRHTFGTPAKPENRYDNIKISGTYCYARGARAGG